MTSKIFQRNEFLSKNPNRLRVLANEVEILQNNATQRTKQLKKAELNHAQHCSERDALRNEKAKMNTSQSQLDIQV